MAEQNLLYSSLEQLQKLTGLSYQVEETGEIADLSQDAVVISIGSGDASNDFLVELKTNLQKAHLPGLFKMNNGKETGNKLLVCKYISKPLKKDLKDKEINYLDLAGNAFIKAHGLFVYINDQPVTAVRQAPEGKIWNVAGLKFLFSILQEPDLLNQPLRTMAARSGIALGTVGSFIEELRILGYVDLAIKGKKTIRFIKQKDELIDKWAMMYYARLRPKLLRGKFRFLNPKASEDWKAIDQPNFLWGGDNAGDLLTNFLSSSRYTLYSKEKTVQLMRQLKLVPDPDGSLTLFEIFWEAEQSFGQERTVPPLIAYADLINEMDSRCQETAIRIKKKYLSD